MFNVLLCKLLLVCRERRSQKGGKVIVVVAEQAAVDTSIVVNSSRRGRVHPTSVIIAVIAFVDGSMVSIHCTLQGWISLVVCVYGALNPRMLCLFVQEGVDGAQYLAVAPALFVAHVMANCCNNHTLYLKGSICCKDALLINVHCCDCNCN